MDGENFMENPMNKWMIWGVLKTSPLFLGTNSHKEVGCLHPGVRLSEKQTNSWQPDLGCNLSGTIQMECSSSPIFKGILAAPPKLPPPRNKGLIAGLIKGNQWLISP